MLLTVGVVQIGRFQRFIIEDYERETKSFSGRDSFVAIAAKELEIDFQDLARHLNVNFNGVQGEGSYFYWDEVYFYEIKNALKAKEWLEGQLVAKKLMGKKKNKQNRIIYGHSYKNYKTVI